MFRQCHAKPCARASSLLRATGPDGAADDESTGLASSVEQAYKLNHMVQYPDGRLDASFAAISDATRRGVLQRLGRGDASITDLAGTFRMTLTGMRKHVGVLEQAGLVTTEKVGRVRTCRLGPRRLEEEVAWIEQQRRLWDARFDALEQVVAQRRQKEQADGHPKRS
jgi:DNA-binding transcriptional ArsR family regulator